MRKVLVSVILNTYNNEKTVQKALDTILAQKTEFDFEILVYDDASTDKTAEIIQLYSMKYPEKIKPIFQTENQRTKGVNITNEYQYTRVQGKYIAFSEPDGYWTNENKLQTQLDLLEHHPDISMCAHSSIILTDEINKKKKKLVLSKRNCVMKIERIISLSDLVPVNSIMYRANSDEEAMKFCNKYPFMYAGVLQSAIHGGVLYLGEIMSVCTEKRTENVKDEEKRAELLNKLCEMLEDIDKLTNYEYSQEIELRKTEQKFKLLRLQKNYKEMNEKKYKRELKKLTLKEKFKVKFSR